MDVECSIAAIKNQLEKFPESMKTHDQLHRLETERVKKVGGKYRQVITRMLRDNGLLPLTPPVNILGD